MSQQQQQLAGTRHDRSASPKGRDFKSADASPIKSQSDSCSVAIVTTDPDLPMDAKGKIYHLDCTRDDIADNIILVGDPGRVPVVAASFDRDSLRFDNTHREIRIMTGTYNKVPCTVLSTGMGTDNIEIVVNELHALKEKDITTGKWAETPAPLRLIRVGTCGSPNARAEVGTLALTRNTIGMDNTCCYYKRPPLRGNDALIQAAIDVTPFGKAIRPYVGHADSGLLAELTAAVARANKNRPVLTGITCSGSGFYGCQGRQVGRLQLGVPTLLQDLAQLKVVEEANGAAASSSTPLVHEVINIEMECSALCVLAELLGYKATAVCAIIATRLGDRRMFASPDVSKATLTDAIHAALMAVTGTMQ